MLYKWLFKNVILPISEKFTGIYLSYEINTLNSYTKYSHKDLEDLQNRKLEELLTFAVKNSPYYRSLSLNPTDISSCVFIRKFPILTKDLLNSNSSLLLTQDKSKLIKNGSSGSTGRQTYVYWSKKEQTIHRATQLLWWQWAGYELGDYILQTGINPHRAGIKKVKDFFFRTKYIQAFSLHAAEVVLALRGAKSETFLAGYASSLFVFSQIARENKLNKKFKSSIAWGDKLFDHYKKSIQDTFGCRIYETYASAEGLMIAAQKDLNMMYIMSPNVYIEIVDENGNEVPDGTMGRVLVTNLNGFAMPLIRYEIGDLAIKLPRSEYPLKREFNFPILKRVIGRDTDIVKTYSGKFMVVHSFTGIFEHIPEIKQFCVLQENIHGILIYFVRGDNFSSRLLIDIKGRILNYLDENFEVEFQEVDHIPSSPSGKPQLIISHISKSY